MAEELERLQVPAEKQKYIMETLNPMLEHMVAQCISDAPADPLAFMLDFLEMKKVEEEEEMLSPEEKERIRVENDALQQNVSKVKSEAREATLMVRQISKDESEALEAPKEEEEEEDEEDDEPPADFYKDYSSQPQKARQSVSAEAYGEWNAKKAFVPPIIPKSDEQKQRLKTCLLKSFLFDGLEEMDLKVVIDAMKEVLGEVGQTMINQGDAGDFLFVIESGKLDCSIKLPDGSQKVVRTCCPGDVFGELALLYNCPRKASVSCVDACVLWQLDRDTFNAIVKDGFQKKRQRNETFLAKVPLLASMDAHERSQLADALRSESFEDQQVIMTQGEEGQKFYIVEEGKAVALRDGAAVMSYSSGDYFGELALIRKQARSATVKCEGAVRVLSVDSGSFFRVLDVNTLLERSTKYN